MVCFHSTRSTVVLLPPSSEAQTGEWLQRGTPSSPAARGAAATAAMAALHWPDTLSAFCDRQDFAPKEPAEQYFSRSAVQASKRPPGPPPCSETLAERDCRARNQPGDCGCEAAAQTPPDKNSAPSAITASLRPDIPPSSFCCCRQAISRPREPQGAPKMPGMVAFGAPICHFLCPAYQSPQYHLLHGGAAAITPALRVFAESSAPCRRSMHGNPGLNRLSPVGQRVLY